ncbi:MAG: hypothetical protein MOB07_21095 [Acidobacteria bacterium]|nr:hypothetical protein [Acidobacteriota bacterium]
MLKLCNTYRWGFIIVLLLVLGLPVSNSTPPVQAQGNLNPGIIPNNAKYQKLSALWWQWALSAPAAVNPVVDLTGVYCAQGQGVFSNNVWFLAGTFGGPATRTCTIPPGQTLFFPVLNILFGFPFDCNPASACDVDLLRAQAAAAMDNPILLEASIDGIPVQELSSYRAISPVLGVMLPVGNVIGLAPGTYSPEVSDGYWLLVTPLNKGSHTIHFKGINNLNFETEVTYHITVSH